MNDQHPWRTSPRPWHPAQVSESLAVVADWLADTDQHEALDQLRAVAVVSLVSPADQVTLGDIIAAHQTARAVGYPDLYDEHPDFPDLWLTDED